MIPRLAFAALVLTATPALAHDFECNGKRVPPSVKLSCCGKADAHILRPDQLTQDDKGNYIVTVGDASHTFPATEVQPSDDGCIWSWYSTQWLDGKSSPMTWYCLRVPMEF